MEIVDQEPWAWMLFQDSQRLFLSVVCGTVGLYDVNVELSETELELYRTVGLAFVSEFARTIRDEPKRFASREIGQIPGSSEAAQRWQQTNSGKA